jgi:acyl transferase domain-containing protein
MAFLFPGQGAQQAGMAQALYNAIPAFRAVIDDAARILRGGPLENLPELLLSQSGKAATAALAETERTQPALFITEFAVTQALGAFGIHPTSMIGHSIGEYVAACVAGMMEFEDALRLVIARGRLMASTQRGAMLAVSMPETDLLPLLARCGADLAAVNGSRQCVASGTEAQITALAQLVSETGKPAQRLSVSHAFHSSLMEPILDAFAAELAKTRLSPPSIPIVSNLSGDWLKPDEATDPAYWVNHLRKTVRFADGLKRLTADPALLLIEAGPGATLTRLARGAGAAEARAIATQPSETADKHTAFLWALGRLWVAGAPVDRLLAAGNSPRRVPLPGYPFERMRLWIEPGAEAIATQETSSVRFSVEMQSGLDETSSVIADVWREVLGVKTLQPDDNFLALGGDSLIAVRIAAKLRQRLNCDLPAAALFQEGTVAGLARLLRSKAHAAIEPVENAVPVELREEGWL